MVPSPFKQDNTTAPLTAATGDGVTGTVDAVSTEPPVVPVAADITTTVGQVQVTFTSVPAANDNNAAASGLLTTGDDHNNNNNNNNPVPPLPNVDDAASVKTATSAMTVGTVDKDRRTSTSAKTSARMTKASSKKKNTAKNTSTQPK